MTISDILFITFVFIIVTTFSYCMYRLIKENKEAEKINNRIEKVKEELNSIGVVYNHSLKLTNRKSGNVSYIRLCRLFYSKETDKIMASAFICTTKSEVGMWEDDVLELYTIPVKCYIEDIGEWNPQD